MSRPGLARRGAKPSFSRRWDLPGARPIPRRSGAVIFLTQIPLRPVLALLTRRRWLGTEHLYREGAMILCGNHLGPFDAFAYGHLLQASGIAPRFLAKDSLLAVPVLGALLRRARQIPVPRGTSRSSEALRPAQAALERGEALMIFPEGTYSRDRGGWPMQGRLGAARLALATGAPVVPIACWGSEHFWPRHHAVPRIFPRKQVTLLVGEALWITQREGESEREAAIRGTAELMARITALLAEIRDEQPPSTVHDPSGDDHRPEVGRPVPLIWLPPWLRRILR